MILILLLYLVFTSMIFFNSQIMLSNPYPVIVGGIRTLLSALLVLGGFALRHQIAELVEQAKQLISLRFFVFSFCLYVFAITGFSAAMQYLDPVTGCFIFVTAPFITAFILYVQYGVTLSLKKWLGILLGLISVIPIILASSHGQIDSCIHQQLGAAVLFFLSTAAYAYGWVLNKDIVEHTKLSATFVNACGMLLGGLCTMTYSGIMFATGLVDFTFSADFWPLMLIFSVLTFASYNFYAYLLTVYSATFVSLASFLEPAFGLLYGWIIFGCPIHWLAMVSMGGLFAGLYLFHSQE